MTAADYIRAYQMQPHPEGGYYVETYRSAEQVAQTALPPRFSGARAFSTAIYFLLEGHHRSALHRIQADEVWHFYAGGPLLVYLISPDGVQSVIRLGSNPLAGEVFQAVVPAGYWFGSKPDEGVSFSLVGCTVAPGFDFADFELAERQSLLDQFPGCGAVIQLLTDS